MKTLPFKTILDVKFSQNFCYDNDLARIYYDDFIEETPIIKILNSRHEITDIIIFATEEAKREKHYNEKQLEEFKKNPRELIAEWLRYDAYEMGFEAGSVINHKINPYSLADCVEFITENGIDEDEYTKEEYDDCKEELETMLADLAIVKAEDYVKMLNNEDEVSLYNELKGFCAHGYSQGDYVSVYFYNEEAQKEYAYINSDFIQHIFYDSPISGTFEMVIGDEITREVYVNDYIDDCYLFWDKDVKESVINKICADIAKDENNLPYSQSERELLAEKAREWLNENVKESLNYKY
jgi:hypothetical protein|nr:MAG TPA: hypothetical protein [Caudoviricetes sp.]